jgi:hypothetical protein
MYLLRLETFTLELHSARKDDLLTAKYELLSLSAASFFVVFLYNTLLNYLGSIIPI